MNVTVFMRKLVVAAAVAAAWLFILGAPEVAEAKKWQMFYAYNEDGSYTVEVYEKVGKTKKQIGNHYYDKDNKYIGSTYPNTNPVEPGDYADKPLGHKDGPAPGRPNYNLNLKVEPSLTKWTKEGFQPEKGMGFGIQGRGSKDPLINPSDDDTGGGTDDDDKPKGQPLSEKELDLAQKDLGIIEQMLGEQMPGVNVSMAGMDYVRLHNPVPGEGDYEPPKTPGLGGGGPSDPDDGDPDDGDDKATAGDAAAEATGGQGGPPSSADAYMQSLINPDPFAASGGPFVMLDLTGAMEIDKALLGGLPAAPNLGVALPGQGAMAPVPALGPSQAQAPMGVPGSQAAPAGRGEQAPGGGQAPSPTGLSCPPPCK